MLLELQMRHETPVQAPPSRSFRSLNRALRIRRHHHEHDLPSLSTQNHRIAAQARLLSDVRRVNPLEEVPDGRLHPFLDVDHQSSLTHVIALLRPDLPLLHRVIVTAVPNLTPIQQYVPVLIPLG
jgi:hypothetical protein